MNGLQLHLDLSVDGSSYANSYDELNSILYLHPSTMADLSATNGCSAIMGTSKGRIIVELSSHDAVKSQSAVFYSSIYKYYISSTISVVPLKLGLEAAKEVYIYPEKFRNFMVSADFQSYTKKIMRHIYVRENVTINVDYLGYSCYFTIKRITPNIVETISTTKSGTINEDLQCTPKMNSVDIDEFKVQFDSVQTSTPISSRKDSARAFRTGNKAKEMCEEKFYFLHSLSKIIVKQFEPETHISFKDIVALDEAIKFIKSSITSILQSDSGSMNVFPTGILLIGPSGSGKSMIGKALKSECSIPVFIIECQKIKSAEYKDGAELDRICKEAVSCSSASIIYFDDLDMIYKNDDLLKKEEEFLRNIESFVFKCLNNASNVLLIASAKNVNLIPSYLRKNGFLEKELYTNISSVGRKQIFLKCLKEHKCLLSEAEINEIIEDTNGFTGGQLQHLCDKAKQSFSQDSQSPAQDFPFTFKDLKKSLKQMKPNVPFNFEIPNVKWSDIGGMKEVKEALTEMISWPLRLSSQFKRFRIAPSRGILMYGPPGCSKTMVAKALVTEGNFNFIPVKASELFNKYVGESEKTVSDLFKRARTSSPCVLFFDEIDSLTSTRNSSGGSSNVTERVLTQLLTEIDGIEPLTGVCILGATNRPDIIDPSFLRPGRFDHMIYVPLPDLDTRCEIFNVKLRKMPTSQDVNATYLVNATKGYSGAEVSEICQIASKYAIREDAASVSMKHFDKALKEVSPKTSAEMIQLFEKYEKLRTSHS